MTEDQIEQSTLETLRQMGWRVLHGPDIGPDLLGERDYRDVVLQNIFRATLSRLNPQVSTVALDEDFKRLIRVDKPTLLE
ncbi:hypothetical protein KA021_01515, partial [Candidatus Saccharibacteria bacterium]|nr:hypothetical protein [Candidatus Saccharibacteria bacterium]